jgi:hypothetical protein
MTGARLFVSSSGTLTTCRDLCYSAEPAYGGWPMIEIRHKETSDLLLQMEAEDLIDGAFSGKDLSGANLRHTAWFN